MSLDKRHYLPKKSERKVEATYHPIYKMATPNKKEFERVEEVLDNVVCDIVNGLSKSDIFFKLRDAKYPNMKKGLSEFTTKEYYEAAMSRLSLDRDRDEEQIKNTIYAQYLNLYREAMEEGSNSQAKAILDSLVKLYGFDRKPVQNVNIEAKDGNINVSFGFENNDDEKNEE